MNTQWTIVSLLTFLLVISVNALIMLTEDLAKLNERKSSYTINILFHFFIKYDIIKIERFGE